MNEQIVSDADGIENSGLVKLVMRCGHPATVYVPASLPEREAVLEYNRNETDCPDCCYREEYQLALEHAERYQLPRMSAKGLFHIHATLKREAMLIEYEQQRGGWSLLTIEEAAIIFEMCYRIFARSDSVWWLHARGTDMTLVDMIRKELTPRQADILRHPTITNTLTRRAERAKQQCELQSEPTG